MNKSVRSKTFVALIVLVIGMIAIVTLSSPIFQSRQTRSTMTTTSTPIPATVTTTTTTTTSTNATSTSSSSSPPPRQQQQQTCEIPCTIWSRAVIADFVRLAIARDDSYVAVGTGYGSADGAVYLFDDQGQALWNRTIDRIVLSIAVSANASLVAVAGSQLSVGASILQNGSLYLFDRGGNLLWNLTTGGFPIIDVRVSPDGSRIVAATDQKILCLNREGTVLWSYGTPTGELVSLDSSYDATRVVASFAYLGNRPDVYSWSFVSFDGRSGAILWNYTAADGGEADLVAMSPDSSYVIASSNARTSNGTLYRFTGQHGVLQWARHISPAISIEPARAGSNALVYTAMGTLLFAGDGSLLRNFTVSPTTNYRTPCVPPDFWARDPQGKVMAFLDEQGRAISVYLPSGIAPRATITVDGSYAAVAVRQQAGLFDVVFLRVSQTAGCSNGG